MSTIKTLEVSAPPGAQPVERAPVEQPGRRIRRVAVLGAGSYAPLRRMRNADLERMVTTTDQWIVERTGIRERHLAAQDQATSDLAIEAGRSALARAGLTPGGAELLLVATATPDQITPATSAFVQHGLGATRAAGFDVNAACSGFVHALMTAHHLVAGRAFANALVIGADKLSSITDYEDRESCVLFGDGAGALVLGPARGTSELIDHVVGLDGSGSDLIRVPSGGSREPSSHATVDRRGHFLKMKGRRVFRFAVAKICELAREMTARNDLTLDDIDLLVPHQANGRILEAAARTLGLGPERLMSNVASYGNTSNASIPLALVEAERTGRLETGQLVLLVTFGAGLSWGATLLRW